VAAKRSSKAAADGVSTEVKISPAKGRPMLQWVGKRPLTRLPAYPAQLIEIYDPTESLTRPTVDRDLWSDWPVNYARGGLLFHGDNKEVLAHLLASGFRGKTKLVYIDPPFDSGADYVRKVSLRGGLSTPKVNGEGYALGEQIQYTDIWANDNYLQFMYERLLLIKELLSSDGSIYLHTDWHKGHHLRALMDEVFGAEGFKNEIVWRYSKYQMRGMSRFVNNHDVLFWYSKTDSPTYNIITEDLDHPKLLKRKRWDKESSKIVNVRDDNGALIYDEYTEGKIDDVWADLPPFSIPMIMGILPTPTA
jgi:DNA methylase